MQRTGLLVLAILTSMSIQPPASAARTFKNCAELNKIYKGGVALPGAVNQGGVTRHEPKFNRALYIANKKSDRDRDGIACEK